MRRLPNNRSLLPTVIATAVFWLVVAGIGLFVLMGCAGSPRPCHTCVGPYDLQLRSHRQALEDQSISDAEGAAIAEYLRRRK